ncbi:MAG: glutamate-5-semialdehyde dehydrogenase [Anaerolineales bacterium]|jgi:glutamate-5-semialdehyde dehydrogenase|nr:glutamate-5-semialdehyde dehydrogenase [Anaerolineales bacterium]
MMIDLDLIGKNSRKAFERLSQTDGAARKAATFAIAAELEACADEVLEANQKDIEAAHFTGLTPSLIDRLTLNPQRLAGMVEDLRRLAELPDPIGERFDERTLPNGLRLWRQRVPLGVLGVIYESRPNVTIDVSGLAIKTGNAAILRGGKETIQSNLALVKVIQTALQRQGLPQECIQFISDPDRAIVEQMLRLNKYIDVIIPRGSNALHNFCREHATIPVITGGIGVCHLFVDSDADLEKALPLIHNAKTQRPSVCNSLDTLLVHKSIAPKFLPQVVQYLGSAGVTFKADAQASGLLDDARVTPAGPDDFDTEWLSLMLGLKVVGDLDAAIEHIRLHSTHHSDGILTETAEHADRFIREVDSAAVYVNASTRFTDGAQFGLGAEVAVSTQRLHARGPMGLPELTTYKWVGVGDYFSRK